MKWRALVLCSLAFSVCHAYRVILSVLLPSLQEEFGMSYASLSVLASAYDFGFFLTLIAGGYAAGRLGRKRAVCSGLALIGLSSLASALAAPGPFWLMVYRVIGGLGFSLYFPAGWSLLAGVFPQQERGRAFGIHTSGSAVGRVYGPLLVGALIGWGSWRLPFGSFGFFSLAAALLLLWGLRGFEDSRERSAVPFGNVFNLLSRKAFLVPCILNGLAMIYFMGTVNFYPLFLSRQMALSGSAVSWLVSLISVVSLFTNPLVGHLSDKVGRRRLIPPALFFGGLVALSLPWYGKQVSPLVYSGLIGLSLSANFSLVITYLTEVDPQFGHPLAIGVYNTIAIGSGLIINVIFGVVADFFGLNAVFLVMAHLLLAGSGAAALLLKAPALPQPAADSLGNAGG
ncbi:MAG: MFS transporter [Candidatus Tectomicrobia bacterium]|uniref:MFS transporter n=1 Tax=Tectimicrobiota bacterium TaxID=2528274 RepID=A0A932GQS6_UNCTE|nr:MFS transporter [Candidatus Tectomicrobia bacterium]